MTHPFPYGTRELNYLSQADADFATVIAQCEAEGFRPERPVDEDAFQCLVRSINDQLISLKAAATIWGRLTQRFGNPVSAHALAQADPLAVCNWQRLHRCRSGHPRLAFGLAR